MYDSLMSTNITTIKPPPSPASLPSPVNLTQLVLNVVSQLVLPLLPASFLYTVRTILAE